MSNTPSFELGSTPTATRFQVNAVDKTGAKKKTFHSLADSDVELHEDDIYPEEDEEIITRRTSR